MDLFNDTGYLPIPSMNTIIFPTQHPIGIPKLLAQCPACSAAQDESPHPTAYTSVWSTEGTCASCQGWHSSFFSSDIEVDSQNVTFQDEEFTFLNDVSETANPDHTIAEYTWVDEPSTTTCERCTGTVDLGHADVTVGSCSKTFERSSWSTPVVSATAGSGGVGDEKSDKDGKVNQEEKKEEVEGDGRDGEDGDSEESAMSIRPLRLERSMTALWVLLMVGMYFDS